jgi:1-acyl-sn-glycerol-3-phosphate acyltransferase
MRHLFLLGVVVVDTLVFGSMAILGCLLVPNGNPLVWLARPWAAVILALSGVRVRVEGVDRIPRDRPVIYISNHQSHFDILAIIRALPGQYRVIAKKELFSIPVFGWALWLAGFIKIDRSDRDGAFRSLDLAARKIAQGRSVLIFAEGTRSRDGSLRPFKKGAFVLAIKSSCPIVPVSISGSRAVLAPGSLRIGRGTIDLVVGNPIESAGHSIENKEELMDTVRRAVAAGFTPLKSADGDGDPVRDELLTQR